MKNNTHKSEISNEDFLLCLLDIVSLTPEQEIAELQSIIDDEMKKPIVKRDYKIIIECMFEKNKIKRKLKDSSRQDDALTARILEAIVSLYNNPTDGKS